ncbi:MAG: hypothetical protein KGL39_33645 [Patescibacteria group bacterium]|nr:hypothetical protein [Patescibacteria group bacterium]
MTQLALPMGRSFHHSTLKSPRLKILLAFLRECGDAGATTIQITEACRTTRASSDVSELRANGIRVEDSYEGMAESGRKIYRYRLA